MIRFSGVSEEDLLVFQQYLHDEVMMKRAMARVAQIRAAKAAKAAGGQRQHRGRKGDLLAEPVANIAPEYYHARRFEEMEANAERLKSGENVWDDPDFLPWELKRNEALRPEVDRGGARVFAGGIVAGTEAAFREARAARDRG